MKKRFCYFLWVFLVFLGSCVSFRPKQFKFSDPAEPQKVTQAPGISYHIYEIHPDTADFMFDYEDLRGKGIAPFLLQLDNNDAEDLIFEAGGIAGMVTNEEVYKKTRASPWIYLMADLVGGTMVGYLSGFSYVVVGAASAATIGHAGYMFGVNRKRKRHLADMAPLVARIPTGVVADIVFFMDTVSTENAQLKLRGEKSNKIYNLAVPTQRRYAPRFLHINAAKAVKAEKGQTLRQIARRYKITEDQIYKYNSIRPPHFPNLQKGDTVYVSKKRKKGEAEKHRIRKGETMQDVSRMYGIRFESLHRKNRMLIGQQPAAGSLIYMRKKRKQTPKLRVKDTHKKPW